MQNLEEMEKYVNIATANGIPEDFLSFFKSELTVEQLNMVYFCIMSGCKREQMEYFVETVKAEQIIDRQVLQRFAELLKTGMPIPELKEIVKMEKDEGFNAYRLSLLQKEYLSKKNSEWVLEVEALKQELKNWEEHFLREAVKEDYVEQNQKLLEEESKLKKTIQQLEEKNLHLQEQSEILKKEANELSEVLLKQLVRSREFKGKKKLLNNSVFLSKFVKSQNQTPDNLTLLRLMKDKQYTRPELIEAVMAAKERGVPANVLKEMMENSDEGNLESQLKWL